MEALTALLIPSAIVLGIFAITMLVALYSTYAERKVAAFLQDRYGPDRAGPFGLLQPLADGVKMFMKEEITPEVSDKRLFVLGPGIAMTAALMTSAVIPWGDTLTLFGQTFRLQVADLNIALLYILAVTSIGVYGIMLGGWASNNKFSRLGAIRASSQMISYEIGMGLSIIAVLMLTGTLSLRSIVDFQQEQGLWLIAYQPLGFLLFLVCAFAETNRAPFDLPECETELIGGYHTEYSSMKLGFFLFSEYINMFISSALMATVYFGGYLYPGMEALTEIAGQNIATLVGVGVLFAKIFGFIFLFMWVRWTLPRFRYDQLMRLGWRGLIPLALFNIVLTGGISLFLDK